MPPDTAAQFLGLRLGSPIVVGSSPLTLKADTVRQLSIAGAGAIVLPSLFEEHVRQGMLDRGQRGGERELLRQARGDPDEGDACIGLEDYLATIGELKRTTGIPIIASLCGGSGGSWLNIAGELEEAGADALELTLEPIFQPALSMAEMEEPSMLALVRGLCGQVGIPVCIKLSPFHSHLAQLARRLKESGAAGIVCFSHDPLWEVQDHHLSPTRKWSLTAAGNINPTIAGLQRVCAGGVPISIAASGGVSSPEDLIKVVYAGADVAMITSEIYRSGPDVVAHLYDGLCSYLQRHTISSFEEFLQTRGS